MSVLTKCAGVWPGFPPLRFSVSRSPRASRPIRLITNHPLAAGQQSSHVTPMGETGVLTHPGEVRARHHPGA